MSESQVIARKFRPQTFEQVVGQEAITRTLHNAIRTNRLHHAYLFTGARGVGKTTTARIFARALNCHTGRTTTPCGVCDSCVEIAESRSIDVLEIDAASNTGVDNVREVIINNIQIAPARDRYKIFIIDEVHQLSGPAFNALLKTLEEPPPNVVFIMATTELYKVPETILSRCQVFEFRTISPKKIFEQLRRVADAEKVEISDSALLAVARAGAGSMRDAQSALDQVISFAGAKVSDEDVSAALGLVDAETLNATVRAIAEQNSGQALRIVDEIVSRGYDLRNFCRELMSHLRDLLVIKVVGFDPELAQLPQGEGESLARLADAFSEQDLVRFFSILTKTEQDIRASSEPRFQLEMGLIKLVQARKLYLVEDALNQLAEIQARLEGRGAARPVAPPSSYVPSPPRPIQRASQEAIASSPRPVREPDSIAPKSDVSPVREAAVEYTAAPPPPPLMDEPPDVEPAWDGGGAASGRGASVSDAQAVERIREKVQAKNKMFLLSSLDQADSITIDGDVLRIAFAPANATFKGQVENKQNRALLEEISREVTGRRLRVAVTVGEQSPVEKPAAKSPRKRDKKADKEEAAADPAVRTLMERFHGEIIEVVKPEG
ncbi:MAG TPA: DNA polymerase III subunit gamma/tau [Blastocatellia bacterium]|nr:DNA polymerase III subunit gamma/tau [Blastocatellia bacterium]